MGQKLKTYHLELKVEGPVFIGSGSEIQKKEYLFLNKSTVGVADSVKLYQLAKKMHLERDFEKFMVQDTREDLKHWSIRNHVSQNELKKCMRYMVDAGDIQWNRGKMQIMSCMSDPYGNPYVPGSSLKGMLRTILLNADIIKNHHKYKFDMDQIQKELRGPRKSKNILSRNIVAIEKKAFTLNQMIDEEKVEIDKMSGIIISDSEPLSRDDIILCQKWERHVDGTYKTLNLLRECIKPGTIIKSTLTIDETVSNLKIEDILEAVTLFYEQYYKVFQSKFRGSDWKNPHTVFLGGGSGFVSKTVVYSLFGEKQGIEIVKDIFDKTKVPENHKHYKDTRLGVSPHILKCTRYKGKEHMMGQCQINIF